MYALLSLYLILFLLIFSPTLSLNITSHLKFIQHNSFKLSNLQHFYLIFDLTKEKRREKKKKNLLTVKIVEVDLS